MNWKRFWIAWIAIWVVLVLVVLFSVLRVIYEIQYSEYAPPPRFLAEQLTAIQSLEKTIQWVALFLVVVGVGGGMKYFIERRGTRQGGTPRT